MRQLIFLIISFAAQIVSVQAQSRDSIYTFSTVEIKPIFPGGIQFFNQFIAENFQTPVSTDFKGGKLLVDFVIDTAGTINNVRILRDIGFGTAEEAIRLLPTSERWIPGKQKGKNVPVRYAMPIVIPEPAPPSDDTILSTSGLDRRPEYPGGINAFYKLFFKNFKVPNVDGLAGKIFISFVIEKDGSIGDPKVIRDIGHGTGVEAIRVLKLSELWVPGVLNGNPVRVSYSLPINIGSGMP